MLAYMPEDTLKFVREELDLSAQFDWNGVEPTARAGGRLRPHEYFRLVACALRGGVPLWTPLCAMGADISKRREGWR